jgi:hypothetical protein
MEPKYEEQFTAFIDFLGFSEVSNSADDTTRLKLLNLLLSLSSLRGEFDLQSVVEETGKRSQIKPAISTFSDHIVISFPLEPVIKEMDANEHVAAFVIMMQFNRLLTNIAAAALRIGFLIRGGATIGKLYHSRGVVFGDAMVEAFNIESRTSVYPRVVLSSQITRRQAWIEKQMDLMKGDDGLCQFDYYKPLILNAAMPGQDYGANIRAWFTDVVEIVAKNLRELEGSGKLNELAKWTWFAREFRRSLERMNPMLLKSLGVSLDAISWGNVTTP